MLRNFGKSLAKLKIEPNLPCQLGLVLNCSFSRCQTSASGLGIYCKPCKRVRDKQSISRRREREAAAAAAAEAAGLPPPARKAVKAKRKRVAPDVLEPTVDSRRCPACGEVKRADCFQR